MQAPVLNKKLLRKASIISLILSSCLLIFLTIDYIREVHKTEQAIKRYGENVTQKVTSQVDSIFHEIISLTHKIGEDITNQKLQGEDLKKELRRATLSNANLLGLTAAYEPFCYKSDVKLYAPYFDKKQDKIIQCENFYDYSNRKDTLNNWYILPVIHKRANFNEPGYGPAANSMVVDYGVPFYKDKNKKVIAGTITSTVSLRGLTDLLNSLSLGKTGYGMVISKKGALLAFPSEDYLKARKTIYDLAKEQRDDDLRKAGMNMSKGLEGMIEHINQVTGHASLLFHAPIKSTGWAIAVVIIKDELQDNQKTLRKKLINIALAGIIFIFTLSVILSKAYSIEENPLWVTAAITTLAMISCIALIWFLATSIPLKEMESKGIQIGDKIALNSFLNSRNQRASSLHSAAPLYIPTGIFVNNIEFNDANNVSLSGIVWQKYNDSLHQGLTRGFVFPEIEPNPEALYIEEAYKRRDKNLEIIGWNFRVTLRENLVYAKYPFDVQNIQIMLRHADFDKHVILTPDMDSYKLINPTALPGLVEDLILPGWEKEGTYFDYKIKEYNTDFGIDNFDAKENFPELHYNIVLKRNILSPFITHFIPLIVVAIMLFQVLVSSTKIEVKNTNIGFNAFGVVESCGAFFFVIMLAHIDLRGVLTTEEITYIEFAYFISYFLLLLVSINSILFTRTDYFMTLEYKDNLIPKLLYWPVFVGLNLLVTLYIFY